MVRRAITGFLILAVVIGCAKGRSVPNVTKMVTFDKTEDLSFKFGSTAHCTGGAEKNECTESNETAITFPTVNIKMSAFAIDEHEVTNLQYVHCVAHGACTEPKYGNTGKYDDPTGIAKYYDDKGNEYDNHPVVNVTHAQAVQFCEFVGKRLPTEFEWEFAAKSERDLEDDVENPPDTTNSSIYPWDSRLVGMCDGKEVAIGTCNEIYGLPQAVKSMDDDVINNGKDYIYDMAGNVMEWVADPWDEQITCQLHKEKEVKVVEVLPECCEVADEKDGTCKKINYSNCLGTCVGVSEPEACTGYDPLETFDAANIVYAKGGDFSYRGASYLTNDLCKARTTYRTKPAFEISQGKSRVDLGFRCACTAGECPN